MKPDSSAQVVGGPRPSICRPTVVILDCGDRAEVVVCRDGVVVGSRLFHRGRHWVITCERRHSRAVVARPWPATPERVTG